MESANKSLFESLGIALRKRGGKLGAHLPFTGDANCHHQFIPLLSSHGATRHVFLLTQSPFFPIYYNLPSIKALSLFLFPPCLCTGWLSLSSCRRAARGCLLLPAAARFSCREGCSAQHRASGAEEEQRHRCPNPSPACGCRRRVSTVAGGWGWGRQASSCFYRSQTPA